jgi:hypothetical protein
MKVRLLILIVATVLTLTAVSALPASAYPTGQVPTISLSATGRLTPGQSVSAIVARVKPGCQVSISWQKVAGISPVSGTSDASGNTSLAIASPNIAGTYVLTTSAISADCAAGEAVTLTSKVAFGKIAIIATKIATTSPSLKKKPVISVTGTVKSGTTLIKSKSITVNLNLGGKKVTSLKVKTDAKGAFTAKFTKVKYKAGKYTAVVSFAADAIYDAGKVTTKAVALK